MNDLERLEAICDMIEDGMMQSEIIREIGMSVGGYNRWLAADPERSARVIESRIHSAATYADKAERVLEQADDEFPLRKARELAHHYRWKASKMNPKAFGDRVQQDVNISDPLADRLDAAIRRVAGEC